MGYDNEFDNKINNSFLMFKADDTAKQSVVNKFIPFDGATS